ncbi:MAG TPA: glycosyltransferase [Candidatus Limnocylindrales bacterium]|nr:glycosyltransferase [Candidatus Limnocylindrales bacterium]
MGQLLYLYAKKYKKKIVSLFSLTLLLSVSFYLISLCLFVFYNNDFSIIDKVVYAILILSISYWSMHSVGYLDHFTKSILIYQPQIIDKSSINEILPSKVAIFIPIYNENPELVEANIAATKKIYYTNFEIFLLDDSNDNIIKKQLLNLAKKYNIHYIYRTNRRGYKAGAINDAVNNLENDIKYILILDVDHCPKPDILIEIIPHFEADTAIAFIQTPQYFTSERKNNLSVAYSIQQHIFHKHVCRGLNSNQGVFMCGTNMIVRVDHLKEIGGMNETCITEDIATSFIFHSKGYKSLYLDKIYAEGIPPPSLSAYYTQQIRWGYGTIQNLKKVLIIFLRNPKSLKPIQWWEYIMINGTWYFSGWTLLIWLIYPIVILLFGVRPLILDVINIPFLIFAGMIGCQILTSRYERSYRIRDIFISQGLFFSLFPIYIHASLLVLTGKRLEFMVTPKQRTNVIKFSQLYPQLFILVLLIISIIIGFRRMTMEKTITYDIYIIISWAIYSTIALLCMFYFFYFEDIQKSKGK